MVNLNNAILLLSLSVICADPSNAIELKKLRGATTTTGSSTAKEANHRQLQGDHHHHFKESDCNVDVDNASCTSIATFIDTQTPASAEVKIPCGDCVTMDATDGTIFSFPMGLNIVGKLHIPEDANFTLITKYVLVQGVMRMDPPTLDTKIPRSDGAVVEIVLEGTNDVTFIPDVDTDNTVMACGGTACNIGVKPFAIAGGRLDINAIDDNCPSWTKLDSLSTNFTKVKLTDQAAANCWAEGAELLFTPDGVSNPSDTQVATISSVNLFNGEITLTAPLAKNLTSVQDGYGDMFAVEVALLTRRMTFKPDDNTDLVGGHTIVMHTPHIQQNIKGVEFFQFGQQSILGRYPLHFHMCESVHGSVVSKNLVRESNQRCYVVHGSHNLTLSENVAFDTFGHCFMTEDGGEWNNTFQGNLGAHTKNIQTENKISDDESDDEAATFWMPNPVNHFIDNVAAGSEEFGFWLDPKIRGPSQDFEINNGIDPSTLPLGTFEGNVAHSNNWHGMSFYPGNYRPPDLGGPVKNVYSFKNGGVGFRIGGSFNLHLDGGVLSDNMDGGVDSSAGMGGAKNIIANLTIVGVSNHLDDLIVEGRVLDSSRPCDIIGVTYPPGKDGRYHNKVEFQTDFVNINFEGFETTQDCDATAIEASDHNVDNGVPFALGTPIFDNVTFDSTSDRISVCRAVAEGIQGFALNDVTGAGGFLVQDTLTAFLPENSCQPMEDVDRSCLSSCPNSCFRFLKMLTPGSTIHDGKQMIVTDAIGGVSQLIPRQVFQEFNRHNSRVVYPTFLPGGSYDVSFVDQDGITPAWPGFAYVDLGNAPNCPNYLEEVNINIDYPAPNERCQNPVYNGDLERGDSYGFQDEQLAGMEMITPGAAGTGHALRTTRSNRPGNHGIWNYIDVSCMRAWAIDGKPIRLSGYLRLQNGSGADLTRSSTDSNAPTVALRVKDIEGSITYLVPTTRVATNGDGSWSFFETTIQLPSSVVDATESTLMIEGGENKHILLDEWRIDVDPILMPCSKPEDPDCSTDKATCMVDYCTDDQVSAGYTRLQLKVAPDTTPACVRWGRESLGAWDGRLKCNMRDTGFGRTGPDLDSSGLGMGNVYVGLVNTNTGDALDVKILNKWSWNPVKKEVMFTVRDHMFDMGLEDAINLVNTMFNNTGNTQELRIDVRPIVGTSG